MLFSSIVTPSTQDSECHNENKIFFDLGVDMSEHLQCLIQTFFYGNSFLDEVAIFYCPRSVHLFRFIDRLNGFAIFRCISSFMLLSVCPFIILLQYTHSQKWFAITLKCQIIFVRAYMMVRIDYKSQLYFTFSFAEYVYPSICMKFPCFISASICSMFDGALSIFILNCSD